MKQNTLKIRLAFRFWGLGLLFFLLSVGIYTLIRPASPLAGLMVASVFFSGCIFVAAYISSAQELWLLKKLAEGGKIGEVWTDLPPGLDLPEEFEEVHEVLVSLKKKMDEAVLSQRRFLADASHEMRSPITIMKGDIEIALRRERDAEEYRRILASNLEEIDRLEYLLKDLMFLARTDSNELVMNMAPVRLDEVALAVYENLKAMSVRKEIALSIDLRNSDDECIVMGDGERLKQLFINLVENALRYTPAGGRVDLILDKIAGISKVTVADTGIGIPEAELPRIFDRFYRVDKARARESGGTGLGLCICKWIVDSHNGEISIDSKEGEGTRVTVMLL